MANAENYDLVVIGSGPGGYVACVRAAQLGMKVACVEKDERLGGICLIVGCIPSKALLESSEIYLQAKEGFFGHGVRASGVEFDLAAMMTRKVRIVQELADSVRKLLEGNSIDVVRGVARLAGPDRVEVRDAGSGNSAKVLNAPNILLATGSEPISVPGLEFDGERIVTSTEALSFDAPPARLVVVGGGYIGLELGSLWKRLGSQVTVVEMLPKIAGPLDNQVARSLARILTKQGLEFRLKSRVTGVARSGDELTVTIHSDDRDEEVRCDKALVAVGRRPLTRGLGLEDAGVKLHDRGGQIMVDEQYRTSAPGVYAIGDLIPGPMLAHKASAEGVAAVECMAGLPGEVNYDAIPSVIYTAPEVASVGLTEEQVKERNIKFCVGSFPFSGVARAKALAETEGFVKIIAHANTDRVLGVHIIGPRASEMIAEAVLAIQFSASSEDIARTVHGHPTLSEGLHEAALAVRKCAIHV